MSKRADGLLGEGKLLEAADSQSEKGELLEVVDDSNKVVRIASMDEVHVMQLPHRTVHVLLYNARGLLVQKRAKQLRNSPEHWDLSCAEHVQPHESYEAAAYRGLKEELGIENVELKKVFDWQRFEQVPPHQVKKHISLTALYAGFYDGKFTVDRHEIAEAKFLPLEEIRGMLERGEKLTYWFQKEMNAIQEKGLWKSIGQKKWGG